MRGPSNLLIGIFAICLLGVSSKGIAESHGVALQSMVASAMLGQNNKDARRQSLINGAVLYDRYNRLMDVAEGKTSLGDGRVADGKLTWGDFQSGQKIERRRINVYQVSCSLYGVPITQNGRFLGGAIDVYQVTPGFPQPSHNFASITLRLGTQQSPQGLIYCTRNGRDNSLTLPLTFGDVREAFGEYLSVNLKDGV